MSIQELVTSIVAEQEQSTNQFLEILQQKIEDTIEVRRIELASQMFAESKGECPECGAGKKECECEDEEEDDEEEDDKEEMDEAVKKDEDPVDRPDVPFAGPYRKTGSVKKDQFGNVIKNRAKYLAKIGMAAAMKKEEVEQMDENDLALRSLVSTDPKKQPFYKTQKGRDAAAKKNVPALKSTIKSALGRYSKPNLPEEAEQMDEAFVIHKGKHEPGTKSSLEGTHHGVNVKPVYTSKKEAQTHADKINAGRGYKPGDEKSSLYGGVLYQVSPAKSMKEEANQMKEAAKWRSSSAAKPDPDNDWDRSSKSTGGMRATSDPRGNTGGEYNHSSLENRKKAQVASKGPNAGKTTKASNTSLKGRILGNLATKQSKPNLPEMTDRVTVDKITTELGRGKGLPPKVTTNKIVVDKAALGKLGTIKEMAPPGAKYERMVKHIKKGYSKDGLTKNEKSIAYATAWKAKGREMSEATVSDAQQMNALGMKGAEKAKTMLALRNYRKHGDINKLSPGHRSLVSGYMEKTGGLGAVSRGVANQALKKERMQEE